MKTVRLAIVSTHPIQYYAPLFRVLARHPGIDLRVFYTWSQVADGTIEDPGFGATLKWDIPLLEGYRYEFVHNVARRPGPGHFGGLHTPELNAAIERWGAQAVLVYGWNSRSHLAVLRHFKGRIPVLFRGDSTLLDERSALRSLARWVMLRWVYSHVDLALAVGSNNRDYFRAFGLSPRQIRIVPHSVDVRRFADATVPITAQAQAWRQELRLPEDQPVVVYAGKLIAKKDPQLLLQAFASLTVPAQLVFFGNGELEGELRRLAATHASVHFLPFQNQALMPAVYRVGDAFVLPSRGPGETWGLALNEAMACGRPVIASDCVGGARDLIEPDVTGWVFEARNLVALREVLAEALGRGRAGLLELGKTAQRRSEAWTVEVAATMIAEVVLEQAAARR